MSFKKTLASIVLSGAIALGVGGKAKADYFENFSSPTALNGWATGNNSTLEQTTFEGDGVLKFRASYDGPSVQIEYKGRPFQLNWDFYIEGYENMSETDWPNDWALPSFGIVGQNQQIFGGWEHILGGWDQPRLDIMHEGGINSAVQSGLPNFIGKWFHFELNYDGDKVGMQIYNGKTNSLQGPFSIYLSLDAPDLINLDRLKLRGHNLDEQWNSKVIVDGYLDNVSFTEVPEPTTLGLLTLGATALTLRKREKLDKSIRRKK